MKWILTAVFLFSLLIIPSSQAQEAAKQESSTATKKEPAPPPRKLTKEERLEQIKKDLENYMITVNPGMNLGQAIVMMPNRLQDIKLVDILSLLPPNTPTVPTPVGNTVEDYIYVLGSKARLIDLVHFYHSTGVNTPGSFLKNKVRVVKKRECESIPVPTYRKNDDGSKGLPTKGRPHTFRFHRSTPPWYQGGVRLAFTSWSSATGIRFLDLTNCPDEQVVDYVVFVKKGPPSPESKFMPGNFANAVPEEVLNKIVQHMAMDNSLPGGLSNIASGEIHITSAEDVITTGMPDFWIALHEIGHGLGLSHPTVYNRASHLQNPTKPVYRHKKTIMTYVGWKPLWSASAPSPLDIVAVKKLYCDQKSC